MQYVLQRQNLLGKNAARTAARLRGLRRRCPRTRLRRQRGM